MGLERITSVLQGKFSNYDTDIFTPILDAIGAAAGRTYTQFHGGGDHPDVSMRVIADHLRAMTFLIADGVVPSNEWRGYVLRKIMRRAMRHGKKLGFTEPILYKLVDVVVGEMGDAYPELVRNRDTVVAGRPQRGGAVRRGAHRGSAAARRSARSRRRRARTCSLAKTCSASTTRSACRSTSWRTSPGSAA